MLKLITVNAGFQRRFHDVCSYLQHYQQSIMPFLALATKTHPYLLQTALTFSANCRSTKSTKNLFIAAARDVSAAVQNAAIQTNGAATDDNYFAFPTLLTLKHHKRHQI